jgi:flavin reductase (DIM6/NTAB) family NADH-FMN oxidoreductase RutF
MDRNQISAEKFSAKSYHLWEKQWLLLTSGDVQSGSYNTMTVGWGSIGCIWGKPFVQVFVRPTRHTYQFINEYPTFTLTAFPSKYRKALALLGAKSGRDGDKIKASGLTAISSQTIAAPGFAEAELIIECHKMYWDDLRPGNFLNQGIHGNYPEKDYHRIFFGEILAIYGNQEIYA